LSVGRAEVSVRTERTEMPEGSEMPERTDTTEGSVLADLLA